VNLLHRNKSAQSARHFGPAEAARRLGVSVKALRLYESRGLVAPLRTAADWRTYGPEQMARLHQVIALKRMGLSLARIAELLAGRARTLSSVLALQEQVLAGEANRVSHALALVRTARARLAKGETLSVDDLATLTTETTMSMKPTPEEMKKLFDPHVAKHFSAAEIAETAKRDFDRADSQEAWDRLIADAKALMAKGEDPASPAARDLAGRWRAMVEMFTQGNPDVERRVKAVWTDAMADPTAAPKLPLNPEIFAWMAKAQAAAKDAG
jgi:MerR family transcriptional regulator, thiopeptide resistance regulator